LVQNDFFQSPIPMTTSLPILVSLCLALGLVGVAPTSLQAREPEGGQETMPGLVRLDVLPDGYPPYIVIEKLENGEERHSGILWDVLEDLGEEAGFRLEAHEIPRKRVDQMLRDGFIDVTPRAIEWTDEPDDFLFTDRVMKLRDVFFVRKDSDFVYRAPSDLDGKTIVTQLGYRYPPIEHKFEAGDTERFDVQKHQDLLGFLIHSNRFHAAITDVAVGQWVMKQRGWQDEFKYVDNELASYDLRLMARDDWHEFVDAFNKHLEGLRRSGRLEEIRNRYR